jgi:hypothetical protein
MMADGTTYCTKNKAWLCTCMKKWQTISVFFFLRGQFIKASVSVEATRSPVFCRERTRTPVNKVTQKKSKPMSSLESGFPKLQANKIIRLLPLLSLQSLSSSLSCFLHLCTHDVTINIFESNVYTTKIVKRASSIRSSIFRPYNSIWLLVC